MHLLISINTGHVFPLNQQQAHHHHHHHQQHPEEGESSELILSSIFVSIFSVRSSSVTHTHGTFECWTQCSIIVPSRTRHWNVYADDVHPFHSFIHRPVLLVFFHYLFENKCKMMMMRTKCRGQPGPRECTLIAAGVLPCLALPAVRGI